MGTLLHANAKTTHRVRKEIQDSSETVAALARRLSLNEKTVRHWKNAASVDDKKSGPKTIRSSLTQQEQQVVCAARRTTALALDDLYITLKPCIAKLTRSNLHRCLQRNNLSKLPEIDESAPKKDFKQYQPGYAHIDITEITLSDGKIYLFVGIDRATKYIYAEVYPRMTTDNATSFLKNFIADHYHKINIILTDNGVQFTYNALNPRHRPKKIHPFDALCKQHNIQHRTTQFRHPWTNGQVEITNKIIKTATSKTYHYDNAEQFKKHLMMFLLYYNYQRPLKSLKFQSPYQIIQNYYKIHPEQFPQEPLQKIVGLNN
jgi:transposase InsO family protein